MEVTTEENSQPARMNPGRTNANSSTSSVDDKTDEEDNLPALSSEQLARRPSFKLVNYNYSLHIRHIGSLCIYMYLSLVSLNYASKSETAFHCKKFELLYFDILRTHIFKK